MDKYYTPELSEFFVGFEYERKEESGKLDVNKTNYKLEWIKEIFTIEELLTYSFEPEDNYFKIHLEQDMFRVKYLSKEDIESLGWKPHKEIQYYYKSPCDNFVLRIKYEGLCIYIYDEYTVDELIFEGTVKNKSELRKLFKMLNIE